MLWDTLDRRPVNVSTDRRGSTLPMRVYNRLAVDASRAFGENRAPRDDSFRDPDISERTTPPASKRIFAPARC
jgi:hypothetical protein